MEPVLQQRHQILNPLNHQGTPEENTFLSHYLAILFQNKQSWRYSVVLSHIIALLLDAESIMHCPFLSLQQGQEVDPMLHVFSDENPKVPYLN